MKQPCWDVIVIGAGAAGMMAAHRAAERGRQVLVLEKNRKLGVKILISGGTRCNITHDASAREIAAAFPKSQRRFLGTALAALPPDRLLEFFHQSNVATKVEANGKIFPVSDRAIDVRDALAQRMVESGATVRPATSVQSIERTGSGFHVRTPVEEFVGSRLIIACGGQSYPGCGTKGDGYAWARALGHHIVQPAPALVPIKATDEWLTSLQGITIPDVQLQVSIHEAAEAIKPHRIAPLDQRRGSLLITHVGLSGPVTLDISRVITQSLTPHKLHLSVDFWPEVSEEHCRESILTMARLGAKKQIGSMTLGPLPRRLVDSILAQAQVDPEKRMAELSKFAVQQIVQRVKRSSVTMAGSLGFAKAEVTAGGVLLDEVSNKTMESKMCPGCHFIGEVLDIDGPIGGYNFQAAFSTGWLAGESV